MSEVECRSLYVKILRVGSKTGSGPSASSCPNCQGLCPLCCHLLCWVQRRCSVMQSEWAVGTGPSQCFLPVTVFGWLVPWRTQTWVWVPVYHRLAWWHRTRHSLNLSLITIPTWKGHFENEMKWHMWRAHPAPGLASYRSLIHIPPPLPRAWGALLSCPICPFFLKKLW